MAIATCLEEEEVSNAYFWLGCLSRGKDFGEDRKNNEIKPRSVFRRMSVFWRLQLERALDQILIIIRFDDSSMINFEEQFYTRRNSGAIW